MDTITCSHGATLNRIEEGTDATREAILCTGLTSNIAPESTTGHLAHALAEAGWRSLRFDYCGSLDPVDRAQLRTMDRMREDIASVVANAQTTSTLIARGRAAQPAMRIAATTPHIRHLLLWAPIIWVEAPHSTLKDDIMADVRRDGFAMIDGTRVGRQFLHALSDPSDADVASWVRPDCVYSIVHPTGDEVHALGLAKRLAGIIEANGGVVHFTEVSGLHPNVKEVPREQIAAIVAALG
jgi:hypothetical protein